MQMAGETLIAKLWETLVDKGIGNLLKPSQIRREGKAYIDVKRDEILILAQANRDAEAIRRGELTVDPSGQLLPISASITSKTHTEGENSTTISYQLTPEFSDSYALVTQSAQADILRKEVNVAKAIIHAEDALSDDSQTPPDRSPEEDWLYQWRDYASTVSEDELQQLWGRVLAGEIKAPGTFSVRLLNFLHNLDRDDARLIGQKTNFVFDATVGICDVAPS